MTGQRGVVGGTEPAPPHPKPSPWATDQAEKVREALNEMLREEWEALGLMSYHGGIDDGIWFADLGPDDIGKIRALLHEAAAELASLKDALGAFDEKWYPMLASKVIAEQHEFGHEAAVTAWNDLCRDLRALVESAAASRVSLGER